MDKVASMSLKELYSFKITDEMKKKMQKYDNLNWSAWIRTQISKKIDELDHLEKLSDINFCPQCGKRLYTGEDKFCGSCGAKIIHTV